MNSKDSSNFTLFQDRDLNAAAFPSRQPARFSSEPEGEGMEVCLRGLLAACVVASMMVCGVRLDHIAKAHDNLPSLPDAHTAVAIVQPVLAPAAKTL